MTDSYKIKATFKKLLGKSIKTFESYKFFLIQLVHFTLRKMSWLEL